MVKLSGSITDETDAIRSIALKNKDRVHGWSSCADPSVKIRYLFV